MNRKMIKGERERDRERERETGRRERKRKIQLETETGRKRNCYKNHDVRIGKLKRREKK